MHYKDESIKTVGDFLEGGYWLLIFIPIINFLIMVFIPIFHIGKFILFNLHLREVFTILMNKRIK